MIYVTGDTHGLEDFYKLHIFAGELMRGQVFEVEGKTIFTFGGATSIDRDYPKLRIYAGVKIACPESHILSNFEDIVEFKHWYFGHFHIDAQLSDKYTVLMHNIVKLGEEVDFENNIS